MIFIASTRLKPKRRICILNFITNSLKYTKEGEITLHVARKDGVVTFEVKDTGIGISKTDQAKIFNKFYRSEDYRTRETGGTGLGLYVAAKLAKKLGTKIELTSRLNHGSSFSFKLPADDKIK
jgi:signal transduction histidine kinase